MTVSEFTSTDAAIRWAESTFRISARTLASLGVISDQRKHFADLDCACDALVFPYPDDAWKACAVDEQIYASSPNFRTALWNLDAVLRGLSNGRVERVYVTQGEFNGCALVEAGIAPDAMLTLPNSVRSSGSDPDRYAFVREAISAGLSKAPAIIWCANRTRDGLALRTEMVRIFGAARFWFVDLPEWAETVGDVLVREGGPALLDRVVNGALPWPVAGLYRISELPDPPPLTLWKPGFPEWEAKLHLAPRTLSVVTGHPGHGKTLLWTQIWFNVANTYDVKVAAASFETRPKPHMRRQLRSLHAGALEKDLTREQMLAADAWIEDHYRFMVHPDQRPTLDWFLEMAEVAVVREGVSVIQADPWNRFESARDTRQESETDYIGRCLRTLHAFAHDMNVHVQILAHPAKMDATRKGTAPQLEDISGSKNWDNAVDQGFVVHRDEMFSGGVRRTEATLYCRKSRFEELGFPATFELEYDLKTGAYRSTDYDPRPAPSSAKKAGSGR